MAKGNLYISYPINKVADIDPLISMIETEGNFHIEDYNNLLNKAKKSSQPTRIRKRLEKEIRPLVTNRNKSQNQNNKLDNHNNIKEFWNKDYKASDFVINEGIISLGNYYLKSVRIHKTHKSWLKDIEHIFHIAPEYNKDGEIIPNRFHFVPYDDLSFLLNSISKQVEAQNKRIYVQKMHKEWGYHLYKYLHIHHKFNEIVTRSAKGVFEIMKIQMNKELCSEMLFFNNVNGKKPNIKVPMSDVTIEDGKISVLTKNASFTLQPYYSDSMAEFSCWLHLHDNGIYTQEGIILPNENGYKETPSWNGFLEILFNEYKKSIVEENIEELKGKYTKDTNTLLQSIKDLESISFDTYQSKKGFLERNKEEYLYLFLDKNLKLWYPFQYSSSEIERSPILYSNFKGNLDCYESFYQISFISDEFEYSKTTLNKIAEIIDENWDFVKDYSNWLLTDEIPIKHKIEKRKDRRLRIVTEYYESRLKIPMNRSCKNNIVTFFHESTNHCSDEWWNKYTWGHRTFMIWSKNKGCNTISLFPTNDEYATYTFFVDTSKNSIEVASYIIWRYFTSNIQNKRQGFKLTKIFKLFGIKDLMKESTRYNILL